MKFFLTWMHYFAVAVIGVVAIMGGGFIMGQLIQLLEEKIGILGAIAAFLVIVALVGSARLAREVTR
jgi:hypothetical protein